MDRVSERERSSRRSKDDRERDSAADRKHKHHRHRHHHHDPDEDDGDRRRSGGDVVNGDGDRRARARDGSPRDAETGRAISSGRARDSTRERSRASSHPDSTDGQREPSEDRIRDSPARGRGFREESAERGQSSYRKRKDRDEDPADDPDVNGRRVRASEGAIEEKRERRRFEDRALEDSYDQKNSVKLTRERKEDVEFLDETQDRKSRKKDRKFSDTLKSEDSRDANGVEKRSHSSKEVVMDKVSPENRGTKTLIQGKSGSTGNVVVVEPLTVASPTAAPTLPTKVSSITTNDGNKEVNIIRSDEVPGKSSTDGTTPSSSGRSGNLSIDALTKAKRALQLQKELSEKLKRIPALNKVVSTSAKSLGRDGGKLPSPALGSDGPSMATTTALPSSDVFPDGHNYSSAVVSTAAAVGNVAAVPGLANLPNLEAVKRAQELAAKMGFHQDPDFAPLINMFPGPSTVEAIAPQRPSKAPVLRLDASGREIDEHGNVVNMPKLTNLSTLKVNINKKKKEAFQILKPDLDANTDTDAHFDAGMGINKVKLLRPKRMTFQFVEEGKWSKQAEIMKLRSQFGEARAKELRIKQSQLAKAKAEPDINPNLIQVSDRVSRERKEREDIVEMEWWDSSLVPSGNYVDASEKINMEKITIYVEHPRPIEPPAEPAPPPPQPLKLTKKEHKKLRTQRRLAKERDRQEMIRQGLLEPPKPKVKMSNLMRVLGTEATQDPTKLEMEIRAAAAEREQAHVDRNIARKLTPAERREKKEKKLFEDTTILETLVSVYKVNDLSHPQTRFKVDVNAQENRLSGCVVITDGLSVVVVEGGKKPIRRYGKLMLNRINWAAAGVGDEDDGAENPDKPANACALVWEGSVAKPNFHRFIVHQCRSEAAGRKIFADAGVPHYWDLAVNSSDEPF